MEKVDIEKQFGAAIRKWRERIRLSQEELSKRAGLHRTYVCDVERGARNVSLKNVQKLAEALGVPITSLLADPEVKASVAPMVTDEMVDILVVEDSDNDVTLTMAAFKNWGVQNRVYVVHDGAAALDFLFCTGKFSHHRPADKPQVILLDLHLPKIGGMEVLRRIKADPRTSAIPVIILTGSKDSRDISECKRLGVENYIMKPLDFQSFSDVSLHLNLQWALMKPALASGR